jgi:hydroxyacylglutathione hydrolase
MNLVPLPALQDNDLWLLHNGHGALAADPGDTQPVLPCLQRDGLQLEAILVMHHLIDHLGVDPSMRGHRRQGLRAGPGTHPRIVDPAGRNANGSGSTHEYTLTNLK